MGALVKRTLFLCVYIWAMTEQCERPRMTFPFYKIGKYGSGNGATPR